MMPFHELISFEEAKKIIMRETKPIKRCEEINIEDAAGRIICHDVIASFNIPGFDRAAVDGYVVKAEDTYNASLRQPKRLKIVGKIFAGEVSKKELKKGEAMEIATGAAIPKGGDAVVMVEYTKKKENEVEILKPVYPGENVSKKDEDIKKGEVTIKKGSILNPAKVGVLAALGMRKAKVYARPLVIIAPTGDEIVEPGKPLKEGKIYDINSYTLASLLKPFANVVLRGIVKDDEKEIEKALNEKADYIIFSGGSSVGERDIFARVIERKGKVFFHGIALKPGKPTIFGKVGNALVFGMPGYPTSCLTNAYTLLLPSIKKMGRISHQEKKIKAKLAEKIISTIGRHQIYTVMVKNGKAYPAFKESGAITSMSHANGYIQIPANVEYIEEGSIVEVTLF